MLARLFPLLAEIKHVFTRFVPFIARDRWYFMLVAVAMIGVVTTNTLLIWLIGQPLTYLVNARYEQLSTLLLLLLGVIIVNQLFHFSVTLMSNWLGLRSVGRIRVGVMSQLMALSFPVVDKYQKGDVLARVSHDIDRIQHLIVETPFYLLSHIATLSLYCIMLLWINWQLALLALAITPLFIIHQRFFSVKKRIAADQFLKTNGKLLASEEQVLANMRGINSFNAEKALSSQHQRKFAAAFFWAMRERWLDGYFNTSFNLLIYCSALAIIFAGARAVEHALLSVGSLVSFLLYLGYLSVPIRGMVQIPFLAQSDLAAVARVSELLDSTPGVVESENAKTLYSADGKISFQNVTFAYPQGAAILRDVSIEIMPGETIALVGPSGSGKSTFAKLILRFYDPQKGHIAVDDVDLKDATISSVRRNIAVVWQQPVLISDTIRNNLLLANPSANEQALLQACDAASIRDFIEGLDKKFETLLGSDGVELSGGQLQRLAIAQALLRNAPILLTDEASSALDSETEKQISLAIDVLRKNRTTIMIAHRYSSIRNADRVIYFNGDGTITVGTHDLLMANHKGYEQAVKWQTGEV